MTKNKLIVTAHDFGLCKSVNKGIKFFTESENSIITELELLTNAPGSEEAAEMGKNSSLSLSIGINLTTFKPLSKNVDSLIDKSGNFLSVSVENWDFSAINKFKMKEVAREVDAQWNWFVKYVGKKPSAILARKVEIGDPTILMPVVEKAKKENVPIRTPLWKWKANYGAQSYVEQSNVRSTEDVFVAARDSWRDRWGYDLEKDLDKLIMDINKYKTSELLLFPGFVDEELFSISKLNWQRGQSLSLLQYKPEIYRKIKNNFELISFADL